MTFQRNLLVTGGAGFIGSHVVRLLVNKYPQYRIVNLDKLTYAGTPKLQIENTRKGVNMLGFRRYTNTENR